MSKNTWSRKATKPLSVADVIALQELAYEVFQQRLAVDLKERWFQSNLALLADALSLLESVVANERNFGGNQ